MAMAVLMAITSCKKDPEKLKPEISNASAKDHDGGSQVPLGGTISVDFDAQTKSRAKLDYYHIEIYDHPESGKVSDEYKIIDDDFKNESTFKGLKNAHVHQHIKVPESANTGFYHVVLIVVDEDGNSADTAELETHLTVVEE